MSTFIILSIPQSTSLIYLLIHTTDSRLLDSRLLDCKSGSSLVSTS